MKKYTIENSDRIISWEKVELILGKKDYKKFLKWMRGQTVPEGGVYECDFYRYMKNLPIID